MMSVRVVSRNPVFRHGIVRACRDRNIEISSESDTVKTRHDEPVGGVLLWQLSTDDTDVKEEIQSFAARNPEVKIVVVAPVSLYNALLEAECGALLTAVISESTPVDAVTSVLLLAEQGYYIRRIAAAPAVLNLEHADAPMQQSQGGSYDLGHSDVVQSDSSPSVSVVPPSTASPNGRDYKLSQREAAVLACLCAGQSNKSIGLALGVCDATVKAHLRSSFRRIGATNRTQAAIWASSNLKLLNP